MKKSVSIFLAVLVSFFIGAYFAVEYYVARKVEKKIDKKLEALRPELDVKYEKCKVTLFKRAVSLENINVSGNWIKQPLHIDRITVENIDRENDFPHFARIFVENETVPVSNFPEEIRYALNLFGYGDSFFFNTELDYFFDSEKRFFSLNKFKFDVLNAGTLGVSLKLAEVPDFSNVSGLEAFIFKLISLKVADGKFVYEDKGFYERMVNGIAKYKKISPEEVKRKIKDRIGREFGDGAVSNMVKDALLKFVEKPEKLTVEFHPEKPVSIGTFLFNMTPDTMVKELNLRVEAD